MRKTDHPKHCSVCRGTGWQPAAPIYETVAGRPHRYDTYAPCTHHWSNDDPYPPTPLAPDDPRAIAAFERGYAQGQQERRSQQ